MAASAKARFIEDAAARLAEFFKRFGEIFDTQSDVVQAGAAFFDELGDGGIGARGFEKFDAGLAGREHGNRDFFDSDGFGMVDRHAEGFLVECQTFGEAADGDSEMIDFNGHDDFSRTP
jgi:hypothetical protein